MKPEPLQLSESKSIEFSFKGRFFQTGEFSSETEYCWLVCHGYGQLAQYFIKKFEPLGVSHVVLAVEGLHRFYKEGTSGRVGASWMTKEDRETDISNYISYLNEVVRSVSIPHGVTTVGLGFSQGAATIGRWAMQSALILDHLVMWSGLFPHDVDLKLNRQKLENTKVHLVYGDNDPFLTDERLKGIRDRFNSASVGYEELIFTGGHEILEEALESFLLRI